MEGQNGEQMCPVCTLYLRPGMTLHEHLFTHPKDQVIEALVRLAVTPGSVLSGAATINTNSQFTAITYRQFQTLTTSVPEPSIPMMLNPCLVTQSFNNPPPLTPGVIRSSVPLLSYPYYPTHHHPPQNNTPDHESPENNSQCSYSYTTQTTQTTQTNSPLVTHDSHFNEANCEAVQEIDDVHENYEPTVDPFVNVRAESCHEPPKDTFADTELSNIQDSRNSQFVTNEIGGIHKSPEDLTINNTHKRTEDNFENQSIESIHESMDPYAKNRIENIHEEEEPRHRNITSLLSDSADSHIITTTHNLGTVISNSHRLIANDPTLDYDQDLRADDIDYTEHNYGHLSPNQNIGSPVSDVSNWSAGSGLRVRRDLSTVDDQTNNCIQYVQPNCNASEYVTSDPYDDDGGHQPPPPAQLTNLDNMNYSRALDYSNNQQFGGTNIENNENKEENSAESTPLNIHSDELMPPRGELSGQESLGATENSVWELQDRGQPSAMSYPQLEKERWQILGSTIQETVTEPYSNEVALAERNHSVKCLECDMKFGCVKERRIHVQTVHKTPKHTQVKTEESTTGARANKYEVKMGKAQIIKIKQERLNLKTDIRSCADCGLELQSLKELRKHRRESHEVRRKCNTCYLVFADNLSFKNHISKVHPIECNICGKYFTSKASANTHAKSHMKVKPYRCTVCDKSFVSRIKLNDHNNIHSGEAPYKCPMCDQTFRRQSNLIQHKNLFHLKIKKKIKDYFCQCGEIFHSIKKLHWHKETHDSKPKQCMYCSERYVHSTSLTRHIRHAHDSTYLPKATKSLNVLCPICKITCIRSSLPQHMKIHTGDRPFTCNVCSKEFSTNWNLHMHKWTHASRNSKPYKCKQCKCAFYMQSSYQAHIRSHRNIRPYTCNYCGRQFIRKYNCMRHVKEHETNKSYCCAVCNKTFHRSYYLTEHMRTHTGVKPYTCHICSKTSSTKSNHNKHIRTHHAREPVNTEG